MTYDRSTIAAQVKAHMRSKYGRWNLTAAHNLGVTAAYISNVMAGRRGPSKKILDDMNLMKVVVYVEKESKNV